MLEQFDLLQYGPDFARAEISAVTVIPDSSRGVIYTLGAYPLASALLPRMNHVWTQSHEDASFISAKSISDALVISGNDTLTGATLGADGYLYGVSHDQAAANNAARIASTKLSKIDPETMIEVATADMAAEASMAVPGGVILVPFTIGGATYIAAILQKSNPTITEVFDSAPASQDTIVQAYSTSSAFAVAADQPDANSRYIYLTRPGSGASAGNIVLRQLTFHTSTGLADVQIKDYDPSEFNAAWSSATTTVAHSLMYDQSDQATARLIIRARRIGGTDVSVLARVTASTGAILWAIQEPDERDPHFVDYVSHFSDLSEGTLLVPYADGSGTYLLITLADGSFVTGTNANFEAPEAAGFASIWISPSERLIIYKSDKDDLSEEFEPGPDWGLFGTATSESGCQTSGFDMQTPPCVTRWTQAVRIVRRDAVAFRFTALDRDLEFRDETYVSCASLDPSAMQTSSQAGEVSSAELAGLMSVTGVDEEELYGGLFDDAFVEIWLVPYEGGDFPRRLGAGWAGRVTQSVRGYKMEVLGPGARLEQRPVVQVYSPLCRWVFGDERCTVDLDLFEVTGTVTSGLNRGSFLATLSLGTDGGIAYENGKIVWLTGANAGQTTEIKTADFGTGHVTLWALTVKVPQPGDTFEMFPGCAQDKATCRDVFNNYLNFGGFAEVPGFNAIVQAPDAKL